MQASDSIPFTPVLTGVSFQGYGESLGTGITYYPVITGQLQEPKREVFSDRTPPTCGNGNYYRYTGAPLLDGCLSPWGSNSFFTSSIDAEEHILRDNRDFPEQYNRVFTNGVYGFSAHWSQYYAYPKPLGSGRLWIKRFVSAPDRPSSYDWFYTDYFDSANDGAVVMTLEDFKTYVEENLDRLLTRIREDSRWGKFTSNDSDAGGRPYYPGYDAFQQHEEFGELPRNYGLVAASAYLDQAKQLPRATTNSIANVLEGASIINDAIHLRFGNIADLLNPKNAWLAYRYSYNTTKADIDEYKELTLRLNALAKSGVVTSYGYASSGDVLCHCTAYYDPESLLPHTTKQFLEKYGLKVSLINAWDMLPYSFVVDWFLSIGDFLQSLEDRGYMLSLSPLEVWYSFSSFKPNGEGYYFRVKDRPRYNAPFIGESSASVKTTLMRVADSISLFT